MPADDVSGRPDEPERDMERPSIARIYDYWLGGNANFAADREVARRVLDQMPSLRETIWANRAFLRRAVARLVTEYGITQFIDLGSGVPTVGNVHEIAQAANPDSRVVYVDVDPVAVAHGRRLLAGNARAATIRADLRDTEAVLGSPELRAVIDLDRPAAVLMISVLHFVPDRDDPARIVRSYTEPLAPGSFLALSHGVPDSDATHGQADAATDYRQAVDVPFILRPPEAIAAWLRGLSPEPPGLVPVNRWHPDGAIGEEVQTYGVLARTAG